MKWRAASAVLWVPVFVKAMMIFKKKKGLKSTVNANAIGTFPPREREG